MTDNAYETFAMLIHDDLVARIGDTAELTLSYGGNKRAPTIIADILTKPEHPEAPIHTCHVEAAIHGGKVPPADPADEDLTPEHTTRAQHAGLTAGALAAAVASGEWLPVDADPLAGLAAIEAAEAERQAQDEARAIADERAAAEAAT